MKKISSILCSTLFLAGCATISGVGTDNTPKPSPLIHYQSAFTPHQNWSVKTGIGKNVTLINLNSGKIYWKKTLNEPVMAGPSVGDTTVIVGDKKAGLWALSETNGKVLWHSVLPSPITAQPVITQNQQIIVKLLDGELLSLDGHTGKIQWQVYQNTPLLVLAGGSQPVIMDGTVMTGGANGKLAAYSLKTGRLKWKTVIAEPKGASDVEQMVDITGNIDIKNNKIYGVTYQGNLAAVNSQTGEILWKTPLSSYTGLALSPGAIFVTDQHSGVWAFDPKTGNVIWHQQYLHYRKLTAPVITGNDIVMGDGEGFVHWLNQATGQTVARVQVDKNTPIITAPLVRGNQVIIINSKGVMTAWQR